MVEYRGCELRVLNGCRVDGAYAFRRTSLSRDTIEIKDEDDLYAKIPLGAASLEGELGRSGRLAVKTTVVGQFRLDGAVPTVPDSGACRTATHVVTALSVGSFELLAGGAVKGSAGVAVGSAGAGLKHRSEESTVRSAGSATACARTRNEADPDCRSPIQIFLEPVAGASATATVEPTRADERPSPRPASRSSVSGGLAEPDPDQALEVQFELPPEGGRWMLLSSRGELLCELPCTRWVGKDSGFKLQLDADKKDDIKVVAVPGDLGYSPGRRVRAVPQPAYNSSVAGALFYGGILGAVGGAVLAGTQCKSSESSGDDPSGGCIGSIVLLAAGGIAGVGGGIWWYTTNQPENLDVTLVDGAAQAGPRLEIQVGLGGLRGSF